MDRKDGNTIATQFQSITYHHMYRAVLALEGQDWHTAHKKFVQPIS